MHHVMHYVMQVLVSCEGYRPVGAALQCRVGGVAVPALFVSVTSVRCLMPPYAARWGASDSASGRPRRTA